MPWVCQKCRYPNPDTLGACFKCAAPHPAVKPAPVQRTIKQPARKQSLLGLTPQQEKTILYSAIGIAIFIAVIAVRELAPETEADAGRKAYVASRYYVRQHLQCPSSAKFPYPYAPEVIVWPKDGYYIIAAYVDAQNAFGAMVRSDYICAMERVGKGEFDFVCRELAINGHVVIGQSK